MTETQIIEFINQFFEIQKKSKQNSYDKLQRNIERGLHLLEESGYSMLDPTGELYNETRVDCQATILSDKGKLIITDVIKPIVLKQENGQNIIVQQARVIIG